MGGIGASEGGSAIEGLGVVLEVGLDDFLVRFLRFEAPLVGDRNRRIPVSEPITVGTDGAAQLVTVCWGLEVRDD